MRAASAESDAARRLSRTVPGALPLCVVATSSAARKVCRRDPGILRARVPFPGTRRRTTDRAPRSIWPSEESPECNACSARSFARTMSAESSGSVDTFEMTRAACASADESSVSSKSGRAPWSLPAGPAPWLAADVLGSGADEAVAGNEVVIEKREWLVCRERRQPQREPRELHRHRIEVNAKKTARGDLATERHAIG